MRTNVTDPDPPRSFTWVQDKRNQKEPFGYLDRKPGFSAHSLFRQILRLKSDEGARDVHKRAICRHSPQCSGRNSGLAAVGCQTVRLRQVRAFW